MATSISKLAIIVGTEDRQLRAGLRQSESLISRFGGRVAGIFAGAFSFGAVVASIKSFASQGAALDDMSKRTGATVEALSALGYAARQTGTSAEAIEAGIIKMSVFLAKAAEGGNDAAESLAKLGLNAKSLLGQSIDQRFVSISKALSKIVDPGQRAAAALKVFGRGGKDLLPLLADGEQGVEALTARAKKLGLVMSGEAVAAAAKLDDQISELTDRWNAMTFAAGRFASENGVLEVVGELITAFQHLSITSARGWADALSGGSRVAALREKALYARQRAGLLLAQTRADPNAGRVGEFVTTLRKRIGEQLRIDQLLQDSAPAFAALIGKEFQGIGKRLNQEIVAPAKNFGGVLFQGIKAGASFMDRVIDTRLKSLATFDTGLVGALEAGSQEAVIADIETRDPLAQFKQEQQALLLGESQKQTPILTAISNGIGSLLDKLGVVGIPG